MTGMILLDLGSIFVGMIIGISTSALVMFSILSRSLNRDIKKLKKQGNIKDTSYIKHSDDAIKKFKDRNFFKGEKQAKRFTEATKYGMLNIAYVHNKNKRNPIDQLTTMQLFDLHNAISSKVEQIFSTRTLRILKKVKLSDVYTVRNASTNILNQKAVKTVIDKKVTKHFGRVMYVINFVNPLYYARKLFISRISKHAIDGIYVSMIEMICYETNIFYQKKTK